MNKLQKFLQDLVGVQGYQSLKKGVGEDNLQKFAAPRVLLSWLVNQVVDMNVGDAKTVLFPGTGDKFITLRKGTGDSYDADLVSHGAVLKSYSSQLVGDNFELPLAILEANGINPEIPDSSNYRSVMAAVGKLSDALVKSSLKAEKKQTSMEEDHKVHDSQTPEETREKLYNAAAKDKSIKRRVPGIADSERPESQIMTQKYQDSPSVKKGAIKETKQKDMEEDHKVHDDQEPEETRKKLYNAAANDKSIKRRVPGIADSERPQSQTMTQKYQDSPSVKKAEGKTKPDQGNCPHCGQTYSQKPGPGHDEDCKLYKPADRKEQIKKEEKSPAKKAEPLSKPYVSQAQRGWAHTAEGKKALGGEQAVHEWDESSKGKKLPEHVKKEENIPTKTHTVEPSKPKPAPSWKERAMTFGDDDVPSVGGGAHKWNAGKLLENKSKIKKGENRLQPQRDAGQTGVHRGPDGESRVGTYVRSAHENNQKAKKQGVVGRVVNRVANSLAHLERSRDFRAMQQTPAQAGKMMSDRAKQMHHEKLQELKAMPSPKLGKGDLVDMKSKKVISSTPTEQSPKQSVKISQEGDKKIAPKSYVKEKWNPNGPKSTAKAEPKTDDKEDVELAENVEDLVENHMEANKEAEAKEGHKMAKEELNKEHIGFNKLKSKLAHEKNPPSDPAAVAASIGRKKYGAKGMAAKSAAAKKGEMPSGAGIPQMPKAPKPSIGPSKNPMAATQKQAQLSGKGKQMVAKPPKMSMPKAPSMAIKSEQPIIVNLQKNDVSTPCEHCRQPQFTDGKFTPCICFSVEKNSKDPFVKLVKSDTGLHLEFRKGVDPEAMKAFLLTLKLSLLAKKINRS